MRFSLIRVMRRAAEEMSQAVPRHVRGRAWSSESAMQPMVRHWNSRRNKDGERIGREEGEGGGGCLPLPQPRSTNVKEGSFERADGGRVGASCSACSTTISVSGRGIRTSAVTKNSWL
jgi:hypothetical protein